MLDPAHVRKINLIEVLLEDAELQCPPGRCVEPPPEDEVLDWSEDRIRDYFAQQLAALSLGASRPGPGPAASLPSELPCEAVLPARAISADGGPEHHRAEPPSSAGRSAEAGTAPIPAAGAGAANTAAPPTPCVGPVESPAAATAPASEPGNQACAGGRSGGGSDAGAAQAAPGAGGATAVEGAAEVVAECSAANLRGDEGSQSTVVQLTETERQQRFQRWFPGLKASGTATDSPRLRLLAFHSSGNAEDMWTSEGTGARRAKSPLLEWCRRDGVELLAVQLPGRAARLAEPFLDTAQDCASQLLSVLAPLLAQRHVPYAVVSHSLGCWLAYELLRAARAAGLPRAAAWCLSAMPAPDLPAAQRPWRQQRSLGTHEFQEEVRGWDVNEVVFTPDMWKMYEPILRADFKLFDEYQAQPGCSGGGGGGGGVAGGAAGHAAAAAAPFDGLPITAFFGTLDRRVTPALMAGWARVTSGPFQLLPVEGNHLWPLNDRDAKAAWLEAVVAALLDATRRTGPATAGA
ncbi:hypothetical protein HXX76_006100 [Chlamydomonas incerta]|uniref:Thioesterase domain-containing protein n=1 Tax=Chlamydomonas incerta TaxID=51695 RepID=A0A835TGQ7_CHLIN|nr:hypothetical protein HXX76_006100 [Chlamydomonas incerta]|eukprot:KAG2437450.1 hypothetical protein HXX76_006100 [Chlamydomonas incerta]